MLDISKVREDFPMIKNGGCVYFDSGATSFKPQCVIDEVCNYYTNLNCNIHRGDYDLSFKVSSIYDSTRETVRKFINAKEARSIVFTNGASSSLNTVAYGYGQKHLKKGDVILTTAVEHASSILPWFKVAEVTGAKIEYIPLNEDGTFNLDKYEECFKSNVKIVCITHVSNVLGYIYPINEITKIAHKYGALVNVDGAQAVPHIKVDVQESDIDFLSFSSHKMCGPAGVGVLYGKYELLEAMDPFSLGGGANARFDMCGNLLLKHAPDKFEAGTPCIEGVLGLKKACEYLMDLGMENIHDYEKELVTYFMDKMKKLDNVEVYNQKADVCIVSFNVKGIFAQDVATYLNKNGFAVRSGNHCAKILLNIIGASETIRASLSFYNTKEEIDEFIEVIKETTLKKCIEAVL